MVLVWAMSTVHAATNRVEIRVRYSLFAFFFFILITKKIFQLSHPILSHLVTTFFSAVAAAVDIAELNGLEKRQRGRQKST